MMPQAGQHMAPDRGAWGGLFGPSDRTWLPQIRLPSLRLGRPAARTQGGAAPRAGAGRGCRKLFQRILKKFSDCNYLLNNGLWRVRVITRLDASEQNPKKNACDAATPYPPVGVDRAGDGRALRKRRPCGMSDLRYARLRGFQRRCSVRSENSRSPLFPSGFLKAKVWLGSDEIKVATDLIGLQRSIST